MADSHELMRIARQLQGSGGISQQQMDILLKRLGLLPQLADQAGQRLGTTGISVPTDAGAPVTSGDIQRGPMPQ